MKGLVYIAGFLMFICTINLSAQVNDDEVSDPPQPGGIRIGFNLARSLMIFAEPSRFGLEAVADVRTGTSWFAVAEGGYSRRFLEEPTYDLRENGLFMRFGMDRDFFNKTDDVIGLGARLGLSIHNRAAPFIQTEGGYWNDFTGSLPVETFYTSWAEIIFSLKTEVFSNLFLGWSIRGKLLLFDRGDNHMDNRYIPGFGETNVNSIAGFDFYIFYRFPFKF